MAQWQGKWAMSTKYRNNINEKICFIIKCLHCAYLFYIIMNVVLRRCDDVRGY